LVAGRWSLLRRHPAASLPPRGIGIYTFLDAWQGVAAVEWNKAAFEDEVLVKPEISVCLTHYSA
jgi:hypothetical protein